MGNQVCCSGANGNDFEHFQQAHHYNRRARGGADLQAERQQFGHRSPNPGRRSRPSRSPNAGHTRRTEDWSSSKPGSKGAKSQRDPAGIGRQIAELKQQCLLVDRQSLDFQKPFNPTVKSALAAAALNNKNGCKITSKQFLGFSGQLGQQGAGVPCVAEKEDYKFFDFSQRRKVGFRGAYEFDNKRLLVASDHKIKIYAYIKSLDGNRLLQAADKERMHRSKSPFVSPLRGVEGPGMNVSKNTSVLSDNSADLFGAKQRRIQSGSKSLSKRQSGEATPNKPKLACFEIANFTLPEHPQEKIVFVKFLDDNDPRLLFLVTYNSQASTTYMKVIKIEKSKEYRQLRASASVAESDRRPSRTGSHVSKNGRPRVRSLSFYEHQPITDLKKEIIDYQKLQEENNRKKASSKNPNAEDNMGQLYRPKNGKNGFANTGNLKATLQPASPNAHSSTRQADISITRLGMNKPIKIKTEWDPHGTFNNLVKQLIEEMDTLEEAEPPNPGELVDTFKYAEKVEESSKADISKLLSLEGAAVKPG